MRAPVLLPFLGLACLLAGALLAADTLVDEALAEDVKPPGSLRELDSRLAALNKQIDKLLAEAKKDPDELKIQEYKGYTSTQLKKTRGRIRARDLIEFMKDTSKHVRVREKAMHAIHEGGAIKNDPELSTEEKQGPRTKRAHFCKTQVVKLLKSDDRITRGLADQLLKLFWPVNRRNNAPIMDYKADKESTWKGAIRAWDDYLRKS